VAVMSCPSRSVDPAYAFDLMGAYSLFNDVSTPNYQFRAREGTMGKNFNAPGAFGPRLLTEDELPPGCQGQQLQARLHEDEAQSAPTSDLMFDIITPLCEMLDSKAGDIFVIGPPSDEVVREPPLWMKPEYVGEVELEGRNPFCAKGEDFHSR
jgi:acylpyruvate hydrolase